MNFKCAYAPCGLSHLFTADFPNMTAGSFLIACSPRGCLSGCNVLCETSMLGHTDILSTHNVLFFENTHSCSSTTLLIGLMFNL